MANVLFDLIDRDYDHCLREEYPRQIKTRRSSFQSILQKFTNFRLKWLESRLDKLKDKALTDGYTEKNFKKKIEKKSENIARLENKIMVLSKIDVPKNYVSRRAIKLRNNMCANLMFHSNNMYSIGLDKKDEIFENEMADSKDYAGVLSNNVDDAQYDIASHDMEKQIGEDVGKILDEEKKAADSVDSNKIDVSSDSINRQAIVDAINSEFSEASKSHVADLSREDIKDSIHDSYEDVVPIPEKEDDMLNKNLSDVHFDEPVVSIDPFSNADVNPSIDHISSEDIRTAIGDEIDRIKFSRNNSNSVNFSKFDEDGNIRLKADDALDKDDHVSQNDSDFNQKFNYQPMTDEEIKASQEKIGEYVPYQEDKEEKFNYQPMTDEEIKESQEKIGEYVPYQEDKEEKFNYQPMTDEEIKKSQEKIGEYVPYQEDKEEKFNYQPMTDEEIKASQEHIGEYVPYQEDKEEKSEYQPMTDEEIKESQEKIGEYVPYQEDESDEKVVGTATVVSEDNHTNDATPVREVPIVVQDREEDHSNDNLFEIVPDATELTEKDIPKEDSEVDLSESHDEQSFSLDAYNALREKILYLKEQQEITKKKREEAERKAEEVALKAKEVDEMLLESEANYAQSMDRLRVFSENLKEACNQNIRDAEEAEADAKINNDLIISKKEKMNNNNRIINEIGSLLGDDTYSSDEDQNKKHI